MSAFEQLLKYKIMLDKESACVYSVRVFLEFQGFRRV